jgi:ribonuclease HII
MILGVDEVGRGCLAGPVVAGAVILGKPIRGLKDSKKLTKADRSKFDVRIRERALAFGLGWVSAAEIDELGMTRAVKLAMERAVAEITIPYNEIIIDGNYNYLPEFAESRTLVKADDLIPEVSAASIIAKVARDAYMTEMAKQFPNYKFESHVGYATALHQAALAEFGICELHRRSFAPIRAMV